MIVLKIIGWVLLGILALIVLALCVKLQITAEVKPGADLSSYSYSVKNNASFDVDGKSYHTVEPATVNGEVLSGVRVRETATPSARGGRTGEERTTQNEIALFGALMAMCLLIAADPKRIRLR